VRSRAERFFDERWGLTRSAGKSDGEIVKSKQSKSKAVALPEDRGTLDAPEKWTVFYSWQSDIPRERGQGLLRHAIREAAIEVETLLGDRVRVEVDEATRGLPGSPDILTSLLKKISGSPDIAVGGSGAV
jgi:hypothetical protein